MSITLLLSTHKCCKDIQRTWPENTPQGEESNILMSGWEEKLRALLHMAMSRATRKRGPTNVPHFTAVPIISN